MRERTLTSATEAGPAVIVLDTNVVLDWLLFNDPSSNLFAAAIARREVRWAASPAMRDELVEVLRRGLATTRPCRPRQPC